MGAVVSSLGIEDKKPGLQVSGCAFDPIPSLRTCDLGVLFKGSESQK